MQLLPGDKILVASYFSFRLYDTSSIEVVANIPLGDPPTWPHPSPTWDHGYRRNLGISQPYFYSNTKEFRLIFYTRYAVNGFTIPCRSGEVESQPKCVQLMDLNTYYSWPESSESSLGSLGLSNSLVGKFDENWSSPEYFCFR